MSIDLIEGFSWIVERPWPETDVVVSDVVNEDGEKLIRLVGLNPTDFLTAAEASALAGALAAASDELPSSG